MSKRLGDDSGLIANLLFCLNDDRRFEMFYIVELTDRIVGNSKLEIHSKDSFKPYITECFRIFSSA